MTDRGELVERGAELSLFVRHLSAERIDLDGGGFDAPLVLRRADGNLEKREEVAPAVGRSHDSCDAIDLVLTWRGGRRQEG